ncbi:hypothetical protein IAU59_005027 [Kwoniella sp. CBS 9459]
MVVDLTENAKPTSPPTQLLPLQLQGQQAKSTFFHGHNHINAQAGPSALPPPPRPPPVPSFTPIAAFSAPIIEGGPGNAPVFQHFVPGLVLPTGVPAVQEPPETIWDLKQITNAQQKVLGSYHCRLRVHANNNNINNAYNGGGGSARRKGKEKDSSLPCDAILASYDLLLKHVKRHITRSFEVRNATSPTPTPTPPRVELSPANDLGDDDFLILPAPSEAQQRPTTFAQHQHQQQLTLQSRAYLVARTVQCGWINCKLAFSTPQALEEHLVSVHLEPKVRSTCPLKGCTDPPSLWSTGDIQAHIRSSHRQLISSPALHDDSFSPSPFARLIPPRPPPLDSTHIKSHLISQVPSYLISCPIIRPFPKGVPLPIDLSRSNSPPASRYQNHTYYQHRRQPPRLAQIGLPIAPDRNEDDVPFYPTCGEASPGYFVGFSCSIFPSNKGESGESVVQPLTDRKGRKIIPSSSRADQHPFTVRKRPTGKSGQVILGKPKLALSADIYAERQKTLDAEKKSKLKGKFRRAMARNGWQTKDEAIKAKLKKLSFDQIRKAGMRFAAKQVGTSVGYAFWKEVVRFEAEIIGKQIKAEAEDETENGNEIEAEGGLDAGTQAESLSVSTTSWGIIPESNAESSLKFNLKLGEPVWFVEQGVQAADSGPGGAALVIATGDQMEVD